MICHCLEASFNLAMIVVVLTLIIIMIIWIEKHDDLMNKLDNYFNHPGKLK